MKITLHKQVTLKVATVYMKIKKDVMRSDIQEYLNGKRFNNTVINNRIDEYLKEIRIYDENKQLSKLGQKVRQTGLLPTPEEGKYRIWYTENDEYFGSVIMYFQCERPHDKANVSQLNLGLAEKGHFLMPTRENSKNGDIEYTKFELFSTDLVGTTFKNIESVEVKLLLDEGKQSCLQFSGTLGKDGATELNYKQPIPRDEKLEAYITEILPDYDSEYKRLRVPFYGNKNFVSPNLECRWRGFSGSIDSINLMPFDLENAKRWRDSLVRDIVAEQYLSPQDFQSKVIETNDNPAFEKYRNDLDVLESKNFKTETNSVEYWHLNAPIDLNPNSLFTNINEIITLQKGDKISFAEIVSKLGVASENDIVIYYDKYISNEWQQKASSTLMESINATKAIIVTDMSPQNMKSDYIMRHKKNIKMRDLKGLFSNRPSHDRYLIVGNKYWSITNSIDFIRFSERDITKDTQGTVNQNVTFTPISILDKELLNFVNTEKNGK